MNLISSKAALCGNIMEDPVHHSSPQNEPADHQSSSQNVNHSSPQNEPISNSRNMTRTARRHVSPKQTSGVFCRICHEGDFMESLLSPCSCSGSVGVVHRSCLEKWLSSSQYDTCELCRQPLTVTRRYRPVLQWLCQGENSGDDQRNLAGDLACLVLLTPLASVSAFLCTSGASIYASQGQVVEAAGLVCLCAVLCLVFLLWLLLTVRYHCQVWLKWRNAHQEIRLQGSYQKKTKNSRERITPRANMVDVREDVGVGKDHVPEQHAEPTLPPHPPTSSTVESNSASLSVKEPACLPLSQAPPPNAPAQPDWKSRGVLVYPLPNSNSSSEATHSQAPGHPAPPVRIL